MRNLLGVGLFLLLVAGLASAQSTITLTNAEFFIQNNDSSSLSNDLVNVPISFPDQTYTAAQLPNLHLRNASETLVTQVVPTSYYKTENGSGQPYVKTAIARVLFSDTATSTPKIYTLATGNPQTAWSMDQRVEFLLRNTNGSVLAVSAYDILGNVYSTTVDIDGYGSDCAAAGSYGSGFPANCVKVLEDGPVAKIWEIHKMNEAPANCPTAPCLSHLFTNVFYITAIKGKDYVLVDHHLVNSFNFDEVTVTPTGGPMGDNGYNNQTGGVGYSIWQNGIIFYQRAELSAWTPASTNTLFVADLAYLAPSRVDIPSGTITQYYIMPINGQQLLSGAPYYEGPPLTGSPGNFIASQSNYIAGAQSILSRVVVSFGTTITKHPVRDVKVHSGQELSRWNNTRPSYFYPEVPDPNVIDPTFTGSDFAADAQSYLTKASAIVHNANLDVGNSHRFAGYGLGRDQGQAGYGGAYVSDPEDFLKYIMSCKTGKSGCRREYLDAFKLRAYGSQSVTNHLVGYLAVKHKESNLNDYRSPLIEGANSGDGSVGCGGSNNPKDLVGFCKIGYPPAVHRVDQFGTPLATYAQITTTGAPSNNQYNRTMHHWWTMTEPTHMSAQAMYSWVFNADYSTLFNERNRIDTISSMIKFANDKSLLNPTTRGRGRFAKSISFLYSVTHDSAYKTMIGDILSNINRQATVGVAGTKGTNPASGDWYPATYWCDLGTEQGHLGEYCQTFQYFLLAQGVSALYIDGILPSDTTNMNLLKTLLKDNLGFIRTHAYKSQYEVRNQIPTFNNPTTNKIMEGTGGMPVNEMYLNTNNDPQHLSYIKYTTAQDVQQYPGLCGTMQIASEIRQLDPNWWTYSSGNLEWNTLFNEYKKHFEQVWIRPVKENTFTNGTNYGLGVGWITDDLICGLSFFTGFPHADGSRYVNGQYNPSSTIACPDADGDGVTTCAGDCNDNSTSISPGKKETACTNGTDDNCNMLVDCNDPACSGVTACDPVTASFCGNGRLDAGEQCDVGPGVGVNGCGIPPGVSPPLDPTYQNGSPPDAYGYCVPPFTSMTLGCVCANNSFSLASSNPGSVILGAGPTTLVLSGNQFVAGDRVIIEKSGAPGTTVVLTPSNITSSTITVSLSAANTNTLGISPTHQMYVQHGTVGAITNKINFTIAAVPTFGLTSVSPSTVLNGVGTTFSLVGNLFLAGDQVKFTNAAASANTITVPGTNITSSTMNAVLSGSQVTALVGTTSLPATINVQVNQSGNLSNVRTFTVTSAGGSLILSSVNPDTFVIDQDYTNVILTGANIQSGDRAFFTGQGGATAHTATSNFTSTTITTSITASLLQTLGAGIGQLSIHRGSTPTYSNTIPFTIVPSSGGLPTVTLTASDSVAAEQGANTGTYVLSRTGATTASLPVTITMTGTATNGTDYTNISTTQTIPIGASSLNVTLTPIDDASIESTETAIMAVSSSASYTVGNPSAATVNITDNDLPVVTIAATDSAAAELGLDTGTYTITRTGPTTSALTVNFTIAGTATNGSDYTTISTSRIISAGQSSATVILTPIDDALVETNEDATLTISNDAAYTVGTPSNATVTITSDDVVANVSITATDPNASEAGTNPGTVRISRTGSTAASLVVNISTSGTATSGSDYTSISSPRTILAGQSFVDVPVTPIDDSVVESTESVIVSVAAGANYNVVNPSSATVNITDNDLPVVTIAATDNAAAEQGLDTGTYTITRTGPTTAALNVNISLSGTATNGSDFTTISSPRTIPIGQSSATITLTPIDDILVEPLETAIVTITSSAAYTIGAQNNATVNITDDDVLVSVTITANDPNASETGPDTGTVRITRTGSTASSLQVNITLTGAATSGSDYTTITSPRTIPIGQSFVDVVLTPIDDASIESTEDAIITVASGTGYSPGSPSAATINITDNDLPIVTLSTPDATASEPGTNTGTYTISRTGPTTSSLPVTIVLTGTATNGTDYTTILTNQTIAAGSATRNITLTPLDDTSPEGDETAIVTIQSGAGYTLGTTINGTVTIQDNDNPIPVITVTATDPTAAEQGLDTGTYTITRTGSTSAPLTVHFVMSAGPATNGSDYTTISSPRTIPIGQASATITLTPIDDALVESTEDATLTLSTNAAYTIGAQNAAAVSIVDNDNPLPSVNIVATDPTASETSPDTGTFTVSRTGSTTSALTVNYTITGTAANGTDYTTIPTSKIIPIGQLSATIIVTPVDDVLIEPMEDVTLTISSNANYTIGASDVAVVNITDNDVLPIVSVIAADSSAAEQGLDTGMFTVSRTGPTTNNLVVNVTVNGTALGTDYSLSPATTTTVTILAGSSIRNVTLTPVDDALQEPSETAIITVTSSAAYTIGTPNATVNIADNDNPLPSVTIVATDNSAGEGGGDTGTYTITRTGSTSTPLDVTISISGGATNGTDYVAISSVQTIAAGALTENIVLTPIEDTLAEGNEIAIVTLQSGAGYTLGASINDSVTILDNDSVPTPFTATAGTGATSGEINITWTPAGGTPTPTYQLKGIQQSDPITQGGISPAEFDNPAQVWVIDTTATSPHSFVGTPSVDYCFVLKATNGAGVSYSTTSCATSFSGNAPPGPFSVSATIGNDAGELDIAWGNAGGAPAPTYRLKGILRSDPIAQDGTITLQEFDNPPAGTVWAVNFDGTSPYTFVGTPEVEYCFAVKARNTAGTTFTNTECEVAPAATDPTGGNGGGGGGGGGAGGGGGGGGGGGAAGGGAASGGTGNGGSLVCTPTLELCDGIDNDCDTQIDEGCVRTNPITCYNEVQDPNELGIDCGGVCGTLCYANPPVSLYAFAGALASPLFVLLGLILRLFGFDWA